MNFRSPLWQITAIMLKAGKIPPFLSGQEFCVCSIAGGGGRGDKGGTVCPK